MLVAVGVVLMQQTAQVAMQVIQKQVTEELEPHQRLAEHR
jgi:hypothetical protein